MSPNEDIQIAAIRAMNQATIEKYLNNPGLKRLECFTDEGIKELTFATHPSIFSPDAETPISWQGKDALRETVLYNKENFSGKWETPKIYSTQDPNKFWVETALDATFVVDGKKIPYRQPYYVMSFDMENGLIRLFREIMNPLQVIKVHGCENTELLLKRNDPVE
ncbi:Phenazine biosynthesis protein PhzA 1 [Penicillium rolfsii]|nr:Phenazine biosynthesis protein PhzA 1 [Penicillium rolfsii]